VNGGEGIGVCIEFGVDGVGVVLPELEGDSQEGTTWALMVFS
jgi:hypothetical protein